MSIEQKPLPVCTPEEMGVPSSAIEAYVKELTDQKLALHSVLVMRHGKIIFENRFKPMELDFRHRMYSSSKSFVSCAIGLLVEQGVLSLDDKVIKFFPDKAPAHPHPWLAKMTIRDMLSMTTCFSGSCYNPQVKDWVASYFRTKVTHEPGTVFSYNTTATNLLCTIIKRVTGKQFTEVLRPVFDEIGISKELFCLETPCGYEWGGSALMATAHEFAKFANLCMHYGEHEGKQLLPRDYMIAATSPQADNTLYHVSADRCTGYGYQFWCTRHGGFYFSGMGCQYAVCAPKEDILVVTTGYEQLNDSSVEILNAFWREILPKVSESPLPANPEAHASLLARGESLEMLRPDGALTSPMAQKVSGVTYAMAENPLGFKWMRFEFDKDQGVMHYENASGVHAIPFGFGKQVTHEFPDSHVNGYRIGEPMDRGMNCYSSAAWTMSHSLMIYCQVVDLHLAQLRFAVCFKGDTVTIHPQKHAEFFLEKYSGFASGQAIEEKR